MKTSFIPTRLDHDLALQLCDTATLTDAERATCVLVALAAKLREPLQPETLASFSAILRAAAAT